MAVLAEHQTTVQIDGMSDVLPVSDQRLGMDLEWVPFTQATLTVPIGDGAIANLDPTAGVVWATVVVRRVVGRTDTIADITRRYRGRQVASLSDEFAGETLAAVTASTYHDFAQSSSSGQQERTFRMVLRSNDVDRAAGTVRLVLGGAEILLLDDCNHGGDFTVPGATWGQVVTWVLNRSGLARESFGFQDVPADTAPWAGNAVWRAGQSAWDFLQQQLRGVWGYLIYADPTGLIRIRMDRATGQTRTLRSSGDDRAVVNEVTKRARDDGWYEAVHVVWANDVRGVASTGKRGPVKEVRLSYSAPEPAPSEPNAFAARMLASIRGRGTALELLAVSDYDLTPGDVGRYLNPRANLSGRVAAVEWQWPQDEMSVRLREVGAA